MSDIKGYYGVNFSGKRGVHASDPINDMDVVNLRTLRNWTQSVSASTLSRIQLANIGVGFPVYAGALGSTYYFRTLSAGTNLNMVCGDTITFNLNQNISVNGITANTITAGTIDAALYLSAGTPLDFLFVEKLWCGSTGTQSLIRNNFTNSLAVGNFSIIAGAYSYSLGNFSAIAGGSGNTVIGNYSFVGGGYQNIASGVSNVIGGGSQNFTFGQHSSILGGFGNRTLRNFSIIGGGFGNYNSGVFGIILGGNFNTGSSNYNTILGGSTNRVTGNFGNSLGGYRNSVHSTYGLIGNGFQNTIYSSSTYSSILSGAKNNILSGSSFAFVNNGSGNTIGTFSEFSSIHNGLNNSISGNSISASTGNTILNGTGNIIKSGATSSSILAGNFNVISTGISNSSIIAGTGISAISSNTAYFFHAVGKSLTGATDQMVFARPDGHLFTAAAPIFSFTGSGLTSIVNTGGTLGIWAGTYDTVAVLKSISGGSNIRVFSSATENAISLSPDIGINSLYVSGNTILSSTTAMTMTVLSLSGGGTLMVVTDNSGSLSTQPIPTGSGGTGAIYYMVNTGSTHGIFAGMSGSNVFVLKSISGGSNILVASSITENAIYLSPNVGIHNLLVSGDTILSSTTAMTMTVLNLSGGGTQMVVTDNSGNLSTQAIPAGGTGGTTYYMVNTGSTHGVFAGMSGSNVFVLKSLSGYNNILITSSSTTNGIALSNDVVINSLSATSISATTLFSGSTPLSNYFQYLWSAATGSNAIIRNNSTDNIASGTHSWVSGRANSATTTHAFIAQGFQNRATGTYSLILNGKTNSAGTQSYATVLNGINNIAFSLHSSILGGHDNRASGSHGTIVNGDNNLVSSNYSSIFNGKLNSATTGTYAVILGGSLNIVTGNKSTIVNGTSNTVSSGRGFIGNGNLNTAAGSLYTTVLNGSGNTSSSVSTVVINGTSNAATSAYAFVVNGFKNTASAIRSMVLNGSGNTASANYSFILNGVSNSASTAISVVLTGRYNIAGGGQSIVLNGVSNQSLGYKAVILNGTSNLINSNTSNGFIAQGQNNILSASSNFSSIINGSANRIYSSVLSLTLNGTRNLISQSAGSTILNGTDNQITTVGNASLIGAGSGNTIINNNSSILNGRNNFSQGSYSTVISGIDNRVDGLHSFISSGNNLRLTSLAVRSAIIGGQNFTGATPNMVYVPNLTMFSITSSLINTDVATLDTDGRLFRTPFATIASSISLLTATNALNTGSSHGIYYSSFSGISGNTTLIFKSISGGNNIVITSSSTENSIALANDISINSISANTFYSGSTQLNLDNLVTSYWTGSSGTYSLIRNNGTGNIAGGNFSINAGHSSNINTNSHYSGILHAKTSSITGGVNSSIIAGNGNQIYFFSTPTIYATILNGKNNYSRGNYSSILNGVSNFIGYSTTKSTILNGSGNTIQSYSSYNSILNGKDNNIFFNTNNCTIINGSSNVIAPYVNNTTIIAGTGIVALESNAVYVPQLFITSIVDGGDRMLTYNTVDGKTYFKPLPTLSGATNTGLTHSIYAGTFNNNLVFKALSGGNNIIITSSITENAITLSNNIIINSVSAATISGGTFYSGSTPLQTIITNSIPSGANLWTQGNGINSIIANNGSTYAGGYYSLVAGKQNIVYTTNNYASILSGYLNQIKENSTYATIINGRSNYITYSVRGFIGNGYQNKIYGAVSLDSAIVSGSYHQITNSQKSTILNGDSNRIIDSSYSAIIAGNNNIVTGVTNSVIINGNSLTANESDTAYVVKLNIQSAITGGDLMLTYDSTNGRVHTQAIPSGSASSSSINNGLNTYTAGTSTFQSVNISGGTFDNIAVSGGSSFNSLSATTYYSGSTPFENIFVTSGATSGNGTSIFINKIGSVLNFKTISGGTNVTLSDNGSNITINATGGSGGGATVDNGLNTYTAGTSTFQSVNMSAATLDNLTVSATTVLNTLTATTISAVTFSAETIISGSTDLSNLFERKSVVKIKTTQQINSASTSVTISELTFDILAGKQYILDTELILSGGSGGGRFGLSGNTAPAIRGTFFGNTGAVTAFQGHVTQTNGLVNHTVATTTAISFLKSKAYIDNTGSTGTISFIFQAISGGNNISVLPGSFGEIREI